jgi:hypothetical protein
LECWRTCRRRRSAKPSCWLSAHSFSASCLQHVLNGSLTPRPKRSSSVRPPPILEAAGASGAAEGPKGGQGGVLRLWQAVSWLRRIVPRAFMGVPCLAHAHQNVVQTWGFRCSACGQLAGARACAPPRLRVGGGYDWGRAQHKGAAEADKCGRVICKLSAKVTRSRSIYRADRLHGSPKSPSLVISARSFTTQGCT